MSEGIKIQLASYTKKRPEVVLKPYVDERGSVVGNVDKRLIVFVIDGVEHAFFKSAIQEAIKKLEEI